LLGMRSPGNSFFTISIFWFIFSSCIEWDFFSSDFLSLH
jgi:hypothetical protein